MIRTLFISFLLVNLTLQPSLADPVDDDPDEFLAEKGNKAAQKRLEIKRQKAEEEQQKRAAAYAAQKQADEAKQRTSALQQSQTQELKRRQEQQAESQTQAADSDKETLNNLIDLGSKVGSLLH